MAITFKNKKKEKVNKRHNYAGFWMQKGLADVEFENASSSNSIVKAIRLRNYQRAITNFVKILAQKEIPVKFAGTESYTDMENEIVIATDIKDNNFDITAGLALHEASHCKYTDRLVLKHEMTKFDEMVDEGNVWEKKYLFKNILNWIEDRRIDNIVFKTCPGYKAYYHKLYDHYFLNKEITKMLKSGEFSNPTQLDHYLNHIISMMNPAFDKNALPGLDKIVELIDPNNVSRLKNTAEVAELSHKIVDVIMEQLATNKQEEEESKSNPQQGGCEEGAEGAEGSQQGDGEEQEGEGDGQGDGDNDSETQNGNSGSSGAGGTGEEGDQPLNSVDKARIQKALQEMKEMLGDKVHKKSGSKALMKRLRKIQDAPIDVNVSEVNGRKHNTIVYDATRLLPTIARGSIISKECTTKGWETTYDDKQPLRDYLRSNNSVVNHLPGSLKHAIGDYNRHDNSKQVEAVAKGVQLGAILGRKLLTRTETRTLETNRLRNGRIDNKRLAHAGYGIETIFNQVTISTHKRANIHLSIDASGSMHGNRWNQSMQLAATLAKAASMIDNLDIQISTRETTNGEEAVNSTFYDSRINNLHSLIPVLEKISTYGTTPEGLCIEAMIKHNVIQPSNSECDSYFINICDGAPGMGWYGGYTAVLHTKQQVQKLNKQLGVKHIGFFLGSEAYSCWDTFKQMYGAKQSMVGSPDEVQGIAKHMNKVLLNN
jgi:uncharacterized protein with von Willebrand factor type A (vWA) domain